MPECVTFHTNTGTDEKFLMLYSQPHENLSDEVRELWGRFLQYLERVNLKQDSSGISEKEMPTPLLIRFHLSDICTQYDVVFSVIEEYQESLWGELKGKISIIGQPPLNGTKIGLEAWVVSYPLSSYSVRFCPSSFAHEMSVDRYNVENRFDHVMCQRESNCPEREKMFHERGKKTKEFLSSGQMAYNQMMTEFKALEKQLKGNETVADNVIRTWIYCRDIDNNYSSLVTARQSYFNGINLTKDTHFMASTGIEGKFEVSHQYIKMDSLVVSGCEVEQIEYMQAPEYLSPTHIYGVGFERGTKLMAGDRSHYFLSGTASIDKLGHVVHLNDVKAQTWRMLKNVEALLKNHGGCLSDLKQAVVYLRDPADYAVVQELLEDTIGHFCAYLILLAPVCRPSWLIEMDGIAVVEEEHPSFKIFH